MKTNKTSEIVDNTETGDTLTDVTATVTEQIKQTSAETEVKATSTKPSQVVDTAETKEVLIEVTADNKTKAETDINTSKNKTSPSHFETPGPGKGGTPPQKPPQKREFFEKSKDVEKEINNVPDKNNGKNTSKSANVRDTDTTPSSRHNKQTLEETKPKEKCYKSVRTRAPTPGPKFKRRKLEKMKTNKRN